ncbi:MAG: endonuclease domain-containing protein [Bacteroidota bacterium]|nr:endonuclease domain-containing protein [Bacteroidota bacterium]
MGRIYNRKEQNQKRKALRNGMPNAEVILWNHLKGRQRKKMKFRRQFGVGRYAIDFYCPEIKLAIEVDGDTHDSLDEIEYDNRRQSEIENYKIIFLRIKNEEVFKSIDEVILKIENKINELIQ